MKKRGQFYLVAALIIVGITAGLAAIHNSSKTSEEDVAVYDLSQEIDFESAQVIDNGIFQGSSTGTTGINIVSLAQHYCAKSTEDTSFVVVYGTASSANVVTCKDTQGALTIGTGGTGTTAILTPQSTWGVRSKTRSTYQPTSTNTVNIQGGGFDQDFALSGTDQFFVVVRRDKNTDRFVSVDDD